MTPLSVSDLARLDRTGAREIWGLIAFAVVAAFVGAGLGGAATRYGPWVLLAATAAVAAMAAVLADLSLAVLGMLLLLPVGLQHAGPVRVIQLAALLVVALVVAVSITTGRRWGAPPHVGLPLGAVLLAGAMSTAGSAVPSLSRPAFLQMVIAAGLMLSVAAAVDSTAQLRRLVTVLVAVGAGISIAAASTVGEVTAAYGGAAAKGRAEGIFSQPNELGAFTASIAVLALGLWLGSRTRVRSVVAFLALLAVTSALLPSLSRGAWIGAMAGLLAVLVMTAHEPATRSRLRTLGVALVAVVCAALLLIWDHPLVEAVRSRLRSFGGSANPNDARSEIYDEALRLAQATPVLGQGPGTFPSLYAESVSTGRAGGAEHAHNIALTLSVELGLFGLLAFAALATAVLISGWSTVRALQRRGRHRDAALCAGAVGALVTVIGHGIVDYPLRNPLIFFLHWTVAGLVLGYARVTRSSSNETDRSPSK